MRVNLYLVQSPLQALSANEARHRFGQKNKNVLIVRYFRKEKDDHHKHLLKAISFGDWDDIVIFNNKRRAIRDFLGVKDCLSIYKYRNIGVKHIFIGDYRIRWMHQAIELLNAKTAYLLDDGIITVSIQSQYLSKQIFNVIKHARKSRLKLPNPKKILTYLTHWILGITGDKHYRIDLFTAFQIMPCLGQKIIHNDYQFIRSFIRPNLDAEAKVYYFGTKYSEAGYFSLDVEIEFLSRVMKYYKKKSQEVLYIAHRDDSDKKLARIKSELNTDVVRLDAPAEIWFLNQNFLPKKIGGAFSTAVINIANIYGVEESIFFKLPMEKISARKKKAVIDIYAFYESIGFTVLNFSSVEE